MAHTPAPWTADKLEDRSTFNIFASGFGSAMCQVSVMENSTRRTTPAEVAANAALIAAAPELLAALKRAESVLLAIPFHALSNEERRAVMDVSDFCRVTIAKAGGAA